MVAKTSSERGREFRERRKLAGIKDVRPDRHSPDRSAIRWREKKESRYFVAIDGEGLETPDGQVYALLAASDNTRIEHPYGITTLSALEYLVNLKVRHPNAVFVGFGFNYDAMMILRDLTPRHFRDLVNRGRCIYKTYHIEHVPGKWLQVRRTIDKKRWSIRIYDVLGFFQMSFVKAMLELRVLSIGTPDYDMLVTMKQARGEFTLDIWDEMVEYNDLENKLLVDAMTVFRDGMRNIDLEPSKWHGAGAMAEKMFSRYKVKEHFVQPPDRILPLVLMAYHGGRFETPLIGEIGTVYGYDINSAYPTAMADLPSLAGGDWVHYEYDARTDDDSNPFTLCFTTWRTDAEYFGPLPSRNIDGTITYPRNGAGWYWRCEVDAADSAFPGCVTVEQTWICEGVDTFSRPFGWIRDLYYERKELKSAGKFAEQMAIKLGLNSLYGKCAQGIGSRDRTPPYQNYVYAGLITARTRATLLTAAMSDPAAIVCFATDGLYSIRELPVMVGSGLGEWEYSPYADSFFLGSGIYTMMSEQGEISSRGRGVPGRSINWDELRDNWSEVGVLATQEYTVKEFIGYRNAFRLGWDSFCTWIVTPKELSTKTSKFQKFRGREVTKPQKIVRRKLWVKMPGNVSVSIADMDASKHSRVLPISMMFKTRQNMSAEEIEDAANERLEKDGSFVARDSMIWSERTWRN